MHQRGAQRASTGRSVRLVVLAVTLSLAALGGLATHPTPAGAAARVQVVVVVGPAGSSTAKYIANGKRYALQARSYGARVIELYSPNATWTRVKAAAQGANILIYLGHGNGSPSPYGPFSALTKDGLGLNASAGHGNYNVKYWGEYYIRTYVHLAPEAVVILNHLCYASGNSEWGAANPTKSVAMKRADNFAAGFLRANAKAVFAEGLDSASYLLSSLFHSNRTMGQIFMSAPSATGVRDFSFSSARTPGKRVWMDPVSPGRYYRSVVGSLSVTAATVRRS
ncbi:MAG: hypothetical protein ACXW4H_00810 [Candidatus Limnocylindrales bacterium]